MQAREYQKILLQQFQRLNYSSNSVHCLAMIDYYTSPSTLTFDIDESNVIQVIIIVSTTCFPILHNHDKPYTNCVAQAIVNNRKGKVIIIRVSICYDYRHDLNTFARQVVDYIINLLGALLQQKIAVIIED
jgi:hypothetical protein